MDLKIILTSVAVFFAGLLAGSFLNVLICKIPRNISLFRPYSVCCFCKQKTPLISSFPLLAYISGNSKCSNCGLRISVQRVLVEFRNGVLYVLVFLTFSFKFNLAERFINTSAGIILVSVLIVVSLIDWEFMIIPNIIVLPFTLVGLAFSIARIMLLNPVKWWLPFAFSAGAFVFMLIVHLIYPKGMGMGDVKLALMLGAFLVKNVIAGIFLGFLIGVVAGIIFLILRKKSLKQFIPFGPFMSAGGLVALFLGYYISGWYAGLL